MLCDIRKWGKCDNWTLWQLSQCHTFLSSNIRCVSKIPKPLCSIVSVSISLHPMVRKKSKNGHFVMEVLVFNTGTKNVENAIFQFSTWFLKSFPLTEMGPLYLKKNCKPSSTRIYHKLPSWPTHGRVIALAKCIQCGWTVGIYFKALILWFKRCFLVSIDQMTPSRDKTYNDRVCWVTSNYSFPKNRVAHF